jgi:site-specific recombinase XerD
VTAPKDIQILFDEFLFECEYSRKLRPATLKGYRDVFTLFLKLMPGTGTEDITSKIVLNFFKALEVRNRIVGKGAIRRGVKKSTIATYWSKLAGFFTWLQANNHIRQSPFTALAYPTPSYEDKKFLKREEVEKIIAGVIKSAKSALVLKRNLLLIYIFLFCGLRREEVLSLQIRDLDLERKLLTVRKEISKSARTRQVPIHQQVELLLKDYLKERKTYTCQYLFVSSNGDHHLSADGLEHVIGKLSKVSGVRFHAHQFRHTFAVNFLKTSNNLAKLRQLLGHKNILVTTQYLRCLPPSEMKADIAALDIDTFI